MTKDKRLLHLTVRMQDAYKASGEYDAIVMCRTSSEGQTVTVKLASGVIDTWRWHPRREGGWTRTRR